MLPSRSLHGHAADQHPGPPPRGVPRLVGPAPARLARGRPGAGRWRDRSRSAHARGRGRSGHARPGAAPCPRRPAPSRPRGRVAPRHREAGGAPHDRDRARAGAHGLPHGVGLSQGRAPLAAAVHRPPAGPGDLGAPGHRQDPGIEAIPPGAVLLGHRGATVRRDRRRCGDGERGNAPRRPRGGALASRPARRSDPASAEGPARAHRDHPVPRDRAASGRDPGGAPARDGPAASDPRPAGEARPPGRRRRPSRRAPGSAPPPVSSRHAARLPPSGHRGAGPVRQRASRRVRQPRATGRSHVAASCPPPGT